MGTILSSLGWGSDDVRILMIGIDAAGKTTILYRLKLGTPENVIPTIGFNVETVKFQNISFTIWDVGGRDKGRVLWRHYYQGSQALIFVIDSNDKDRAEEAGNELRRTAEELPNAPILVLANKQDLATALKPEELAKRIKLSELKVNNRLVHMQPCSAKTGDGLNEGLVWLHSIVMAAKPDSGFWQKWFGSPSSAAPAAHATPSPLVPDTSTSSVASAKSATSSTNASASST